MEHEIVIRLKVPRWTRRHSIGLAGALLIGGGALAYAAVPNTFNPGDTVSSSKLNDNFSSLQSQITTADFGSRAPSAFHASLTNATTPTAGPIAFNLVKFDVASEYNKVTGAFVAKNAGIYLVTCDLYFTPNGTPGVFEIQLQNNASPIFLGAAQSGTSTGDGGSVVVSAVTTIQLAAGDTVTCSGGLAGGSAALDVSNAGRNAFSATRLY